MWQWRGKYDITLYDWSYYASLPWQFALEQFFLFIFDSVRPLQIVFTLRPSWKVVVKWWVTAEAGKAIVGCLWSTWRTHISVHMFPFTSPHCRFRKTFGCLPLHQYYSSIRPICCDGELIHLSWSYVEEASGADCHQTLSLYFIYWSMKKHFCCFFPYKNNFFMVELRNYVYKKWLWKRLLLNFMPV